MGIELAVTSAIALIGLYAAQSFRRQQQVKIADQRVLAYRKLWALTFDARPMRMDPPENMGPLTRGEAAELYDAMSKWYFNDGDGMMFPDATKRMYFEAKQRLGRYAAGTGESAADGVRRMRELSLLRQQMQSDLAIYGHSYLVKQLTDEDKAFLKRCKITRWRFGQPWYRAIYRLIRSQKEAQIGSPPPPAKDTAQ